MTKRQRIFFRIGAWACVATAGIHLIGHFSPPPTPSSDADATLRQLLNTYEKNYGAGFSRTTMDFLKGFSVSFSLLLLWVGVLCLLISGRAAQDSALLRRISLANAILAGALLAVSFTHFFLPPIVCVAVIFVAFAVSAIGEPAGRSTA